MYDSSNKLDEEQICKYLYEYSKKNKWSQEDLEDYAAFCSENSIYWYKLQCNVLWFMIHCPFKDYQSLEELNRITLKYFSIKPIQLAFEALRDVINIEMEQPTANSVDAIKSRIELAFDKKQIIGSKSAKFFLQSINLETRYTSSGAIDSSRHVDPYFFTNFSELLAAYAPRYQTAYLLYQSIDRLNNNRDINKIRENLLSDLNNIQTMVESRLNENLENSCYAEKIVESLYRFCDPEYYKNINLIKFGYSRWEELIDRGLDHSTIHLIAGRPGSGKTLFMINLLCGLISNDTPALILSLETETKKIIEKVFRIKHNEKWIYPSDKNQLERDPGFWDIQFHKTKRYIDDLSTKKLYFHFDPSTSIEDIEDIVMQTKKKIDTQVIFIDYFQMIGVRNKGSGNSYEKLSYIAQKLKHISVKYKVCIILLVQLNRSQERMTSSMPGFSSSSLEDKLETLEPSLSDLKGTSDLEQVAETVTFIVRHNSLESHSKLDTESEKSITQKNKDTMQLIVKKNRHGRCGSITCDINLENLKIEEQNRGLTEEQRRKREFDKLYKIRTEYIGENLPLDSRTIMEFNRIAHILGEIRKCDNNKAPAFIINNHISSGEMALKELILRNIERKEYHLNVARFESEKEGGMAKRPLWYLKHPGSDSNDKNFIRLNFTPGKADVTIPSYLERKTIQEIVEMRKNEGKNTKGLVKKKKKTDIQEIEEKTTLEQFIKTEDISESSKKNSKVKISKVKENKVEENTDSIKDNKTKDSKKTKKK